MNTNRSFLFILFVHSCDCRQQFLFLFVIAVCVDISRPALLFIRWQSDMQASIRNWYSQQSCGQDGNVSS